MPEIAEKCIWNKFYNKNVLEITFIVKMHKKWFLLSKCIGNGFYLNKVLKIKKCKWTFF